MRLRFDYKASLPVVLKIQVDPENQEDTGTIHFAMDRIEAGTWKTFDRAFSEFNKDLAFPPEGRKINNLYIFAGFGEKIPDFVIDNVEIYEP